MALIKRYEVLFPLSNREYHRMVSIISATHLCQLGCASVLERALSIVGDDSPVPDGI